METTWTIKDSDAGKLQSIIAELKAENQRLKTLLDEHGISYDDSVKVEVAHTKEEITIVDLHIPNRAIVALEKNRIHTIEQLRKMTLQELLALEGIGKKAANVIKAQLALHGLELREY